MTRYQANPIRGSFVQQKQKRTRCLNYKHVRAKGSNGRAANKHKVFIMAYHAVFARLRLSDPRYIRDRLRALWVQFHAKQSHLRKLVSFLMTLRMLRFFFAQIHASKNTMSRSPSSGCMRASTKFWKAYFWSYMSKHKSRDERISPVSDTVASCID